MAQEKEKEELIDRRRGWKKVSNSGQEYTLSATLGRVKTEQDGKRLFQIYLWCPDDLPKL